MKFLVIAGARPNFMKVAPILDAFERRQDGRFEVKLIHTGQHYDPAMSDRFFEDLGIRTPDVHLGVGAGSHAEQTARIMTAFEVICREEAPDWVVVVGDVNSTLACAITAKKMGIRVAHVEAGLRSRDLSMPEEINRICTDAISDLLFTTDELADQNLAHEGITPERIEFVGNTMIDTLLKHIDRARARPLPAPVSHGNFAVLTLHRPSNVDSPEALTPLYRVIEQIAQEIPIVFPVHPRTKQSLKSSGLLGAAEHNTNLHLTEPLGYLDFIGLVSRARLVLTDSGGIQEETTVLGIPCLTMRNNTERPITCTAGTNQLVGTHPPDILRAVRVALRSTPSPASVIPPKWDGQAAPRIVDRLLRVR